MIVILSTCLIVGLLVFLFSVDAAYLTLARRKG
jgi:hypothetical protein